MITCNIIGRLEIFSFFKSYSLNLILIIFDVCITDFLLKNVYLTIYRINVYFSIFSRIVIVFGSKLKKKKLFPHRERKQLIYKHKRRKKKRRMGKNKMNLSWRMSEFKKITTKKDTRNRFWLEFQMNFNQMSSI